MCESKYIFRMKKRNHGKLQNFKLTAIKYKIPEKITYTLICNIFTVIFTYNIDACLLEYCC